MRITVIGTGYVGLVAGHVSLSSVMMCFVWIWMQKNTKSSSGDIPIYEPGLPELIKRNIDAGRLKFTVDIETSVSHGNLNL